MISKDSTFSSQFVGNLQKHKVIQMKESSPAGTRLHRVHLPTLFLHPNFAERVPLQSLTANHLRSQTSRVDLNLQDHPIGRHTGTRMLSY